MEEIFKEETSQSNCDTKKKCNCNLFRWIVDAVLVIAVIVLYVLYFFFPKTPSHKPTQVLVNNEPRSGEIIYINIDSVNANYKLVDILTKDIEDEMSKQEVIFQNRQASLERKYNQFQQNYMAGILTQVQVENAQQQLLQESENLKADYEQVMGNLEIRQATALKQIADSVISATKRINAERNASFVFSYQYGGQLIDADPSKDVTNELLEILNEPYKKKE